MNEVKDSCKKHYYTRTLEGRLPTDLQPVYLYGVGVSQRFTTLRQKRSTGPTRETLTAFLRISCSN